jgi:hypothetical protein
MVSAGLGLLACSPSQKGYKVDKKIQKYGIHLPKISNKIEIQHFQRSMQEIKENISKSNIK